MDINLLFFFTVVPAIILFGIAKSGLGGSIALISIPLMTVAAFRRHHRRRLARKPGPVHFARLPVAAFESRRLLFYRRSALPCARLQRPE